MFVRETFKANYEFAILQHKGNVIPWVVTIVGLELKTPSMIHIELRS